MKCGGSVYNVDEMKDFLRERLSKKRYVHSLNVADECLALARIYGEDEEKCYFAGLIHDICKEIPAENQREMVVKSRFLRPKVRPYKTENLYEYAEKQYDLEKEVKSIVEDN